MGREVTARARTALRAIEKLGPAGKEVVVVPTEKVYLGSSSTLIARASSFGDNLGFASATVLSKGGSTGEGAKNDGRGGAGAASALFTSTLSAWKLYRSFEGSFGAEVFTIPNSGLVEEGGDNVVVVDAASLPLIWTASSSGSIISAGRIVAFGALTSSISCAMADSLAGGVLRRLEGLSSPSTIVIVSTTLKAARIVCVEPLGAEVKGSPSEIPSTRVGFSAGGLERFVPCKCKAT